jgi:hypothetical protein
MNAAFLSRTSLFSLKIGGCGFFRKPGISRVDAGFEN